MQTLSRMRSLESKIQQDADDGGLACSQVDGYLKQIAEIGKATARHDCGISGLDSYAEQIKSASCVK